jgi:hypothetical protein
MIIPIVKTVWASPIGRRVTTAVAGAAIGKVTKLSGLHGHGSGTVDNGGTVYTNP